MSARSLKPEAARVGLQAPRPDHVIDSHCPLADEVFQDDLEAVIERARGSGVDGALCVLDATNEAEAARAIRVAALWPAASLPSHVT